MYIFDKEAYKKRMEWFCHDRFGMFIHWGLYAIPARGEWVRSYERITVDDYEQYFNEFDPVDYDPKAWARMAKDAGMKYAVLTAKHHDGFCLFDTKLTTYKATNTKAKRDLVRDYLEAFRNEGLKAGLYYSIIDWHHPDYPHFGDANHPMRENVNYTNENRVFDRYLDYMHGQINELCSNYGKLDILWFDFSYGEMTGEKWRATDLVNMVRDLQPEIIIDNRLEVSGSGFGSLVSGNPSIYSGDFVSPEQIIPPKGIVDINGEPVCWEACLTMNNTWGFAQFDKTFYPSEVLIRKLVECVSKGGNMLLNIGPDAKGSIPCESASILTRIGEWMKKNGKSIYGCSRANLDKPDFGRYTFDGSKTIYLHIMEHMIGPVPISGILPSEIKSVRLLSTGAELAVINNWIVDNYPDYTFIRLDADGKPSYTLPDSIDTVISIELI